MFPVVVMLLEVALMLTPPTFTPTSTSKYEFAMLLILIHYLASSPGLGY
jgi:hypothetical protein